MEPTGANTLGSLQRSGPCSSIQWRRALAKVPPVSNTGCKEPFDVTGCSDTNTIPGINARVAVAQRYLNRTGVLIDMLLAAPEPLSPFITPAKLLSYQPGEHLPLLHFFSNASFSFFNDLCRILHNTHDLRMCSILRAPFCRIRGEDSVEYFNGDSVGALFFSVVWRFVKYWSNFKSLAVSCRYFFHTEP